MNQRSGSNVLGVLMSAAVALTAVFAACGCGNAGGEAGDLGGREMDREVRAARGDFNITINIEGTLDAIKRHYIKCPERVRYGLEIVEVATNQAAVKKGDTIVRFARQKYLEQERQLTMLIEDERKNLLLAEEDRRMQAANNIASLKDSADKVRQSQEAYDRYLEEDAPFNKKKFQSSIVAAEKSLAKSRQQVAESRNLLSKAYMQSAEQVAALDKQLEDLQKAEDSARAELSRAYHDFRMFKQYDHPEKLRSLASGLTKAGMDLKNNVVQAASRMLQARRREDASRMRIDQLQKEMDELRKMMGTLDIEAPVDGIFTVGDERRSRSYGEKEIIVGTQMNPNEIIGSIPELSKFMTRINVPELYRSKVRVGLPAALTVKAVPDLVMTGSVSRIAGMASSTSPWGDDGSPKQYQAEISTDKVDPRLMPGMTMQVEIVEDEVCNALHVPVEALYAREGRVYCRVRTRVGIQEREVKKGRASEDQVEVLSGIEEGEMVLVHRPTTVTGDSNP